MSSGPALWTVKRGDTCPPMAVDLFDDHGVPLPRPDLVEFVLAAPDHTPKLKATAEILESSPKRLWVQFNPTSLTLDVAGLWFVEWKLTYPGPHVAWAPSGDYDIVRVQEKGSA